MSNQGSPVFSDADVDAYIQSVVDDRLKKQGLPAQGSPDEETPVAAQPSPIKMNIAGQEYTFNNAEEAQAAVNNIIGQTSSRMQQDHSQGRRVSSDDTPSFDMNTFVEKMAKNPIDAYDYVDEFRMGVKNPSQVMKDMIAQQAETQRVLAVYQFKDTHPDYEATPQNAQTLTQVLQQYSLPFTPSGLDAAHALAVRQGLISTSEKETEAPHQERHNPYTSAPPVASRTVSRGPAVTPDWETEADNLDMDAIENIFARFQR